MDTVALDYRPVPSRRARWRRWVWRFGWITILVAVTWAGRRYGPTVWWQGQVLYWQQQCLNYTFQPGEVVYAEDADEAAKLIAGGYFSTPLERDRFWWREDRDKRPTALRPPPPCWQNFRALIGTTRYSGIARKRPGTVVFLHELQRPDGQRRLVCVLFESRLSVTEMPLIPGFSPRAVVFDPATWRTTATDLTRSLGYIGSQRQTVSSMRVYGGQVDPKDPSRFTIRWDAFGQELVLDGALDDSDRVAIKPR